MSELSEKPNESLWVDSFDCDGHCGASVEIQTHQKETEPLVTKVLLALGWLIISKDEAYCPACVKTAERITRRRRRA